VRTHPLWGAEVAAGDPAESEVVCTGLRGAGRQLTRNIGIDLIGRLYKLRINPAEFWVRGSALQLSKAVGWNCRIWRDDLKSETYSEGAELRFDGRVALEVAWDNRAVQHHAVANQAGDRYLERVSVEGTPTLSIADWEAHGKMLTHA
jgi:hypothetical protein